MEKLRKALDERLEKAKYTKRTGSPGKYKYEYGTSKGMGSKGATKPSTSNRGPKHLVSASGAIEKEMEDNKSNIDVDYMTSDLRAMKNYIKEGKEMPPSLQKEYNKLMKKHKVGGSEKKKSPTKKKKQSPKKIGWTEIQIAINKVEEKHNNIFSDAKKAGLTNSEVREALKGFKEEEYVNVITELAEDYLVENEVEENNNKEISSQESKLVNSAYDIIMEDDDEHSGDVKEILEDIIKENPTGYFKTAEALEDEYWTITG